MATLYFNGAVDNNWNTVASFATGSISFSGQPADGDTLTINGTVFEFDNDSSTTGGNVAVVIGVDLATTLSTLEGLVETNVSVGATINSTSLDLISNAAGSGSNYSVSASSSVITTGNMSGGVDGNWWLDSGFSTPATTLPTSIDSVIASADISSNSGSTPTIVDLTTNASLNITLTVSGTCTFNATNNYGTITGNCTFIDNSVNLGTIIGDCNFNNGPNNYGGGYNSGTITGDVTFNDDSYNGDTITGDVTFNDTSYNNNTITGDCIFNDSSIHSINTSIIGNATFNDNSVKRGSVSGTVTYNSNIMSASGSLTYYFNGAVDNDWNTLGNWWLNSGLTIPASTVDTGFELIGLPTSIDSVIASASITSNSGSNPTIVDFTIGGGSYGMYITLTVSGTAIFNNSSHNDGIITGNTTFNNSSFNSGTLSGHYDFIFNNSSYNEDTIQWKATFNDSSYNATTGVIDPGSDQDTTFNDSSSNRGEIYWNVIFNDSSSNMYINTILSVGEGILYGTAKFYNNSYNLGIIHDDVEFYNSSSNITDGLGYTGLIFANVVFYNNSFNTGRIEGNVVFNDDSYNSPIQISFQNISDGAPYSYFYNGYCTGGLINGNAILKGRSYNKGLISGTVTEDHNRGINGSSILGLI